MPPTKYITAITTIASLKASITTPFRIKGLLVGLQDLLQIIQIRCLRLTHPQLLVPLNRKLPLVLKNKVKSSKVHKLNAKYGFNICKLVSPASKPIKTFSSKTFKMDY